MEQQDTKELYGTVVTAVGPVIDVRFDDKHLPALLTALKIIFPDGKKTLVSEVMPSKKKESPRRNSLLASKSARAVKTNTNLIKALAL